MWNQSPFQLDELQNGGREKYAFRFVTNIRKLVTLTALLHVRAIGVAAEDAGTCRPDGTLLCVSLMCLSSGINPDGS